MDIYVMIMTMIIYIYSLKHFPMACAEAAKRRLLRVLHTPL